MNGMEAKLFVPKTLEGKNDNAVFEIARKAEDALRDFPEFVAVAPFGSRVKGYAQDSSDYDFWVYSENMNQDKGQEFSARLKSLMEDHRTSGLNINFHDIKINMSDIERGLAHGIEYSDPEDISEAIFTIANLTRITTGKKIGKYREQIKKLLHDYMWTQDDIEKLIREIVLFLVDEDRGRVDTMRERIPNFDSEKYLQDRKYLWENRVRKILT